MLSIQRLVWYLNSPPFIPPFHSARQTCRLVDTQHILSDLAWPGYHFTSHRLHLQGSRSGVVSGPYINIKNIFENNSSSLKICLIFLWFACIILNLYLFSLAASFFFLLKGSITRHDIDSPPTSERVVSIYKYEDIFMPSAAYQTFSSPFCLLLIVALTFYLLMGTP